MTIFDEFNTYLSELHNLLTNYVNAINANDATSIGINKNLSLNKIKQVIDTSMVAKRDDVVTKVTELLTDLQSHDNIDRVIADIQTILYYGALVSIPDPDPDPIPDPIPDPDPDPIPPPPPTARYTSSTGVASKLSSYSISTSGTRYDYGGVSWLESLASSSSWFQIKDINITTRFIQITMTFKIAFVMTGFKWMWGMGAPNTNKNPTKITVEEYRNGVWVSLGTKTVANNATVTDYGLVNPSQLATKFRFTFKTASDGSYMGIRYFIPMGYVPT